MQTAMYRKKISNYWAVFRRVSEKPWVLSSDSSEQGEGERRQRKRTLQGDSGT